MNKGEYDRETLAHALLVGDFCRDTVFCPVLVSELLDVKVTDTVDVLEFVELAVCVCELVEVVETVLLVDTEAEKEFPVVAL